MEFPIRNLIFDTVEKRSADAGSLPPGFWLVFSVFQAVHRTWFWYRRSKEVWRRENCFELALAIGMRLVVGDSASLRLVAKIVEVTLHTAKCIDDMKRIKKNGHRLMTHLKGSEKIVVKIDLVKVACRPFFSPSTHVHLEKARLIWIERARRAADAVTDLFRDLFFLSMHVLDAQAAFQGHWLQEAEIVVNAVAIAKHKPILMDIMAGMGLVGDPEEVAQGKPAAEAGAGIPLPPRNLEGVMEAFHLGAVYRFGRGFSDSCLNVHAGAEMILRQMRGPEKRADSPRRVYSSQSPGP